MKPILFFLPVFLLCGVFVFVLPHFVHFPLVRGEILPVSVTSLGHAGVTTRAAGPVIASADTANTADTAVSPVSPVSVASADTANTADADRQLLKDDLSRFVVSVVNGQADQLVGVYAHGLFALPVHQQPSDRPEYVDRADNVVTEFALPKKYGSTGLLAHNYLSGSRFSELKDNQEVLLVYGDGRLEQYRISRRIIFRALKPSSPFSTFVNTIDPYNRVLTSAELFNQVYTTRRQLVFQTCIEAEGEPSWGRLFIIASPIETLNLTVPALEAMPSSN